MSGPGAPVATAAPARGLLVLAVATVVALVAALFPVVFTSKTAAAGEGGVDWWAAATLPPLDVPAESGGQVLRLTDEQPVVCRGGSTCIAATERPVLSADIDPDPDTGTYQYLVYDLSGASGLASVAAEGRDIEAKTWAPAAGLLDHGHVFAWTVIGDPAQTQEWGQFVVDLQRHTDQAVDEVGPFTVGLGSGHVFVEIPIATGGDSLSIGYTQPGASTPTMLPRGWSIAGETLGGLNFYELESFADGATVVVHGLDGTSIRYDRDEDGAYQPPSPGGTDLSFLFPSLVAEGNGWTLVDPYGGSSTFAASGRLVGHQRTAPDGSLESDLAVVASGGRLLSVTDHVTGRTATFTYMGDRGCGRPHADFDRGASGMLCQVTGFDGTQTNFAYVDGRLARVETNGATIDMAYDDAGRLIAARQPLAADAVAAGVRSDGASTTWRIAYDDSGRVSAVTSPEPTPGAAPQLRSYTYEQGATTVTAAGDGGPVVVGRVTFDPRDLSLLTSAAGGMAPTVYLYGDDGLPFGWIEPDGRQTSWALDDDGTPTHVWGPAPAAWFDAEGRPLPAHADKIRTETQQHGAGAGMIAYLYDEPEPGAPVAAQRLLTSPAMTELPGSIDPASGWRLLAIGDPVIEPGETLFRLSVDGADQVSSSIMVNGLACAPGEQCAIEATEMGRATLWVDLPVPAHQPTASFAVEVSPDRGHTWVALDFESMRGMDLPAQESSTDTYRLGQQAHVTVEAVAYADPLVGAAASITRNGEPTVHFGYEPNAPESDQWARVESVALPSGLTTTIDHWGSQEYADHPLTGQPMLQGGERKSIQVGTGVTYTTMYDDAGRPVATLADGQLIEAVVYDDRGRIDRLEIPAGADPATSPARSAEHIYGAAGDPLRTDVVITVGDEQVFTSTVVDLLGRQVAHTDLWGVTTNTEYDRAGSTVRVETATLDGLARSTTIYEWADGGLASLTVEAADGGTYGARITGRDDTGRPTEIAYTNGVVLTRAFDPVTGLVATQTWTDADGGTWTETLTGSTQTGRVLRHELAGPDTAAVFDYAYDPTSGALLEADLAVAGDYELTARWVYEFSYTSEVCTGFNTAAVLDGTRAARTATVGDTTQVVDTCYDANTAPVHQIETVTVGDSPAITRDIPIQLSGDDVVAYDNLELVYDISGLLVRAADDQKVIELTRGPAGEVIAETITDADGTTVAHNASGGLLLDGTGLVVGQSLELPGAVAITIPLVDAETTWAYPTTGGDGWWTSDGDGASTGSPTLYSPDGELIDLGDSSDQPNRWKRGHDALTLDLDTTVVVFGARAYIPALGMFTSADPQAHGGTTPYVYANNDPINLADPTGLSPDEARGAGKGDGLPPWLETVISVVLTILMIGLAATGQWWAAALVGLALSGFLAYQSAKAFMRGDVAGGIFYAIDAVMTLTLVGGAMKAALKKTYALQLKAKGNKVLYVLPKKYGGTTTFTNETVQQLSQPLGHAMGLTNLHSWTVSAAPFRAIFRGTPWLATIFLGSARAGTVYALTYFAKRFLISLPHKYAYKHSADYRDFMKRPIGRPGVATLGFADPAPAR